MERERSMTIDLVQASSLLQAHTSPYAFELLSLHGQMVAQKALEIVSATTIEIDPEFIRCAALLHDIGISGTHAPALGCFGDQPYLRHGVIGRRILLDEGLDALALICERHTGAGISAYEIERDGLPLPARDLLPISVEEKLICLADKFFSKQPGHLTEEKKLGEIVSSLSSFGPDVSLRFEELLRFFELS